MRMADETTRGDTARSVGGSREAVGGADRDEFRLSFNLGTND